MVFYGGPYMLFILESYLLFDLCINDAILLFTNVGPLDLNVILVYALKHL